MTLLNKLLVFLDLRALPCKCGSRDLNFVRIEATTRDGYCKFVQCEVCARTGAGTIYEYYDAVVYWNRDIKRLFVKEKEEELKLKLDSKKIPKVKVLKGKY